MAEEEEEDTWNIIVHVQGKEFSVSVGKGKQKLKWLAHVGIARWDEVAQQGWKILGIPLKVQKDNRHGVEIDMTATIHDVLKNNEHIFITTSLQPSETSMN